MKNKLLMTTLILGLSGTALYAAGDLSEMQTGTAPLQGNANHPLAAPNADMLLSFPCRRWVIDHLLLEVTVILDAAPSK
ncbi:MAG: hypothetical protein NTX76_01505 [Alphaproteobacteria bacterium]|nr:hypothetical protein [Alphaproteobacteria bacterium]